MSLLRRAINIVRSNINSVLSNSESTIDFSSFSESDINYKQPNYQETSDDSGAFYSDEQEKEMEYYANFELPYGASFEQIKSQYRKLLKKYHPDKFQNNPEKLKIAQDVVKKLNNAYNYFEEKYRK